VIREERARQVIVLDAPRCSDALDLLESKRLPGGGFAADTRHYSTSASAKGGV
jgi:hypothetical protein